MVCNFTLTSPIKKLEKKIVSETTLASPSAGALPALISLFED